ncbi:MAG: methylated-DNA--[protein]-cysteine S-methyltransferase [Bermanella sp.]
MTFPATDSLAHYQSMARTLTQLTDHKEPPADLAQLADHWGLNKAQLLSLFTRQYAQTQLQKSAALSAWQNNATVACEHMAPGEYKKLGLGLNIAYAIYPSPYGHCLLATTTRGICKLTFFDEWAHSAQHIEALHAEWPSATIQHNPLGSQVLAQQIFSEPCDRQPPRKLLLCGTDFQLRVWQALLTIAPGGLCSYQQVAQQIGNPQAVRAVASAIANNKVALLVPCHRVIKSNGELNQYRWGALRKRIMITREAALNYHGTNNS